VSEIDYIYLYSDGFAQAFTTLEISDHHTLFSENLKLEDITNKITKKWDLDKELTKYKSNLISFMGD
ncbi:hypothetical protein LJC17_05295, partial [Acholeplasma sp. OttesenSCG-928-E16]|nr:hypothetical protein [Acholeplasma sp. OttesenSCG-928-E16]